MSGIIPRSFIDELLNRTDIVEFIDAHLSLKKQGSSFVACCPFHQEKTPSFNVVPRKQFYHCFGCGASGNAISFAMDHLHLSFPESIETLAARAGMEVPREGNTPKRQSSQNLYQVLEKVSEFYQQQLKHNGQRAIEYLKKRGINGQTAKRFQIGYAPSGWHILETIFPNIKDLIASGMLILRDNGQTYDRYRERVMYPIHDRQGRIIGFGGRSINPDEKPKYLNSPETPIFQKSRELYGLHQIIMSKAPIPYIIIVEGYMDVLALSQYGITNVVATLGTATSQYHIQLLAKYTTRIIFSFDGDSAGIQAAWRALENGISYLNTGLDIRFIFLPKDHDPDSLVREEGKEAFLERLHHSTPLNDFLFDTLLKNIDIHSMAGKSQLIHKIQPYLLKMSEGPYKTLIMEELSRRTHIENHRLNQLLSGQLESAVDTSKTIHRSPVRIAIALLIQNPEILQNLPYYIHPDVVTQLQHPLLKELIQLIRHNPDINTGTLIEAFRETEAFPALSKLAAWDHQVPEEALSREFFDTARFIVKQEQEVKIQDLLKKAREEGLSKEERLELQTRLKQRHQPIDPKTIIE